MHDEIVYTGKLFQVVRRKEKHMVLFDGDRQEINLEYELVRRPPGVRAIVIRDGQLLLNREFRYELNGWDYRLPGGKVFDSQEQVDEAGESGEIMHYVEEALRKELLEEADLQVRGFSMYDCSHNGFTVEWDLYYYIVDDFVILRDSDDCLEKKNEFEYVQSCWVDYQTALKYCIEKKISEERSVGMLLRFLLSQIKDVELCNALSGKK